MKTEIKNDKIKNIVSMNKIIKQYTKGGHTTKVLNDLSLVIQENDFLALMGPSGSGKSTLLEIIAGISSPTSGEVLYGDIDANRLSQNEKSDWRNKELGFVFQSYNLMQHLTVLENVKLPLLPSAVSEKEANYRASLVLELVGMDTYANRYPRELSGGQEQRVAIARALINNPSIILADEPTGNLDSETATNILNLLKELNQNHGKCILMVTHDKNAASYAKKIIELDKGSIQIMQAA